MKELNFPILKPEVEAKVPCFAYKYASANISEKANEIGNNETLVSNEITKQKQAKEENFYIYKFIQGERNFRKNFEKEDIRIAVKRVNGNAEEIYYDVISQIPLSQTILPKSQEANLYGVPVYIGIAEEHEVQIIARNIAKLTSFKKRKFINYMHKKYIKHIKSQYKRKITTEKQNITNKEDLLKFAKKIRN